MMRRFVPALLVLVPFGFTYAADAADAAASGTGGMFRAALGLIVVLGLMAGIAWLLKRFGVSGPAAGSVAKVVGGVSVGTRERVMVVEVGDQWIVVGVAPGRVNSLATMPRQEVPAGQPQAVPPNFPAWLKQTIDKRNGNQ